MREIPISGDMIRLGQFLKMAGVVESGAEAKELLAGGLVMVDDEPEDRRGRQLTRGSTVTVDDGTDHQRLRVV